MSASATLAPPDCANCPYNSPTKRPVIGALPDPTQTDGVLVGEGPGDNEVREQRPFVGATGIELDGALTKAGLARSRLAVLNAMACPPPKGEKDERRMAKARQCCAPLFKSQLAPYVNRPILAMGKHAWAAVIAPGKLPKGGISDGRGFVRPHGTSHLIATWHPTFAFFRAPGEMGAFLNDLNKFARAVKGTLRPGPTKLIPDAGVEDLKALLDEDLPISSDIECAPRSAVEPWTIKNPLTAQLRCIGFGNVNWGLSIDWDSCGPFVRGFVAQVLRDRPGMIWQNGAWYDHRNLIAQDIMVHPDWEDTRDARRALSATSPLNLGYMSTIYDDPGPWKQNEEGDAKGLVATNNLKELQIYNAEDCVRQVRVWEGITSEPSWRTPRVQRLYQVHRNLSIIAAEMHTSGFWVHQENRAKLSSDLKAMHEARCKTVIEAVGSADFRANAHGMRSLIYKRYAKPGQRSFNLPDPINPAMWTEKGTIKVDQGSLLTLITSPECPPELKQIVDLYWQADAVRQAASTYVDSELVAHAIGDDGRLRPGWNSAGTDTGRPSCSEPNILNLGEEKE